MHIGDTYMPQLTQKGWRLNIAQWSFACAGGAASNILLA